MRQQPFKIEQFFIHLLLSFMPYVMMKKSTSFLTLFSAKSSQSTKGKSRRMSFFVSKQLKKLWSKWLQFQAWWIKVKTSKLTFLSLSMCVRVYLSSNNTEYRLMRKTFFIYFCAIMNAAVYCFCMLWNWNVIEKWELFVVLPFSCFWDVDDEGLTNKILCFCCCSPLFCICFSYCQ